MAVRNANGTLNYEDAVLDLSNPKTISWYQDKIARLIKQGVSVIKCDLERLLLMTDFMQAVKLVL